MNRKFLSIMLTASCMATIIPADASTQSVPKHVVVAPNCLIKQAGVKVTPLATEANLKLFTTDNAGINKLALAKSHDATSCGGFMDVSASWNQFNVRAHKAQSFLAQYARPTPLSKHLAPAYKIQYQNKVNTVLATLNSQNMWSDLSKLSSFQTRFAGSDNGVDAANWLSSQVESMVKQAGRTDVSIYTVATGYWYKQPSVVVKIGESSEPGIVIGGHMDTLPSMFDNMPGADDDGSGSVTVLEVARTILASGLHFKKPIYLIWYAAEEMGLVGSQYVVADFQAKNIPVSAVMQLDMTGYRHKNDPTMWLYDDYTNNDLTAYVATLINTYVKQPIKHSRCGYGCSDHATWHQIGVAAVMPFEAEMGTDNPDIHSSNDTMEKLSLDHMTSFAKLAIAFAIELAEPV